MIVAAVHFRGGPADKEMKFCNVMPRIGDDVRVYSRGAWFTYRIFEKPTGCDDEFYAEYSPETKRASIAPALVANPDDEV